jgi:2-dehydropantoate 2-reductase
MKIGIVGTGAVGSYYGAMLARDAHDVHFLSRGDFQQVRRHGVKVISDQGNFNVRPKVAQTSAEIGVCDLVVIALKATANSIFPEVLPPLVGQHTAILTLQNGLGNEEALARIFPAEQILGGLCFVCINRTAPGVIHHIAHGKIEMGEFQRWPEPRTHDIAGAFRHAGVPCKVRDNLEKAHWEKLVWNIPFNGLSTASCLGIQAFHSSALPIDQKHECLTTDRLLNNSEWLHLVKELMDEVLAGANAFGLNIDKEFAEEQVSRTRVMAAYKPSTMIDFMRGLPIEIESIFLEPLRRAQSKGVHTPRLQRLCELLQYLNEHLNVRSHS